MIRALFIVTRDSGYFLTHSVTASHEVCYEGLFLVYWRLSEDEPYYLVFWCRSYKLRINVAWLVPIIFNFSHKVLNFTVYINI